MKIRRGRLNKTLFIDEEVVQKVGIVQEDSRPSRLGVEAWALSLARSRGLHVPRVLGYQRNEKGQEVLTLERIDGKVISRKDCLRHPHYMEEVGVQMKMLGNAASGYGWIDPVTSFGSHPTWASFLDFYITRYGDRLVQHSFIEAELVKVLIRVMERVDLSLASPSLVHRDLRPANLLEDSQERIWIVDWENAILGDPLYDVAITGVRYGHGILWENLQRGYEIKIRYPTYLLYEVAAVMGVIDFYRKAGFGYRMKIKRLHALIQSFQALA